MTGWLLDHYPDHEVNTLVGRLLGVVYILALAAMVWRWLARHRVKPPTSEPRVRHFVVIQSPPNPCSARVRGDSG